MEDSDIQLIRRTKAGDSFAFGLLYDKFVKKIYDFVYYKTHSKETAEDLTSDIFMKALEHIQSFTNETGSVSAWLYRIARNRIIDFYRTNHLHASIDDVWDIPDIHHDIEKDIDIHEQVLLLKKYLHILNSEQRDVVIMRVWQQMSYAEIAQIMDKTEASCKMAFSRALKQLRASIPVSLFLLLCVWYS